MNWWVSEQVDELVSEPVNEWVNEKVRDDKWIRHEQVNGWMNGVTQ